MAVREGDHWRLNGQKVWTSRADYADWGICLARTDPERPKHRGLTMFAVRMSAPGVVVRPLVPMNGDSHFSEVFLTDVEVREVDRIGEEHAGWSITSRCSPMSAPGPTGARRIQERRRGRPGLQTSLRTSAQLSL